MTSEVRIGLSAPLRVREFRYLWAAELWSVLGDQLARVALALLVYSQTSSAGLTALTYALTFLPAVLGGMFLSGLADRFPRRAVMVVTDLVRAGLAAVMAVPGLPLPVLWGLVAVLSAAAGPFKAAQLAMLPQVLAERSAYRAGLALRQVTSQIAQLVGFASGGVLLSVVEPRLGLLLNAATFVISALLLLAGVRDRAAASAETEEPGRVEGRGSVRLWPVFALAGLVGLYVVPEGIAAPYADELGLMAVGVGVLMAADPVGSVLGGWLAPRLRVPTSFTAASLVAVAAGVPLLACVFAPGLVVSAVLWAVSGACSTMLLVQIQELVVDRVPDSRRGVVMGRLATCLYTSQGVAIVGGGLVAEVVDAARAVALAGLAAIVLVGLICLMTWVARPRRGGVEDEPDAKNIHHQRSLLVIPGTSSPGPDCQTDPEVEKVGDRGSVGNASSPSSSSSPITSATQSPVRGEGGGRRRRSHQGQWQILRLPRAARAFLVGVEAVAVVLTVVLEVRHPATSLGLRNFAVILGLGILMAEVTKRVERMRRRFSDTPHVNMSSVWTLSAALLTSPALAAATTALLYLHLWHRSWREITGMHPFRVVFSVAAVVLSCHTAFALNLWLPGALPTDQNGVVGVLGLLLVIVMYWVVNSALVGAAIAFLRPDRSIGRLLGSWSENSLEYATLAVGALSTLALSWNPWAVVLVLLPLYVLHRSVLVRQLEHAATTDDKTGLLNAGTWDSLARTEADRAARHGTEFGLLMIDVDHFKSVNERYGHLVGDQALHAIARALQSSVRGTDLVGRFGGEEFVILLVGSDQSGSVEVGQRICESIRALRIEDPLTGGVYDDLRLSVSIGVATYPGTGRTLRDVMMAADNAVFAAKDAGRDQVRAIQVDTRSITHEAGASPI